MKYKLIILKYFAGTRWLKKFRSSTDIQVFQEKMLAKNFKFLRQNSIYFKNLEAITSLEQLSQIPIMDKKVMMDNFDTMNTVGLRKNKALAIAIKSEKNRSFDEMYNGISVGLSSGTSGHRGLFVISNRERSAWAGAVLAKYLPKNKLFGQRIAFFLRADNNLYESVNSHLVKFKYFDIYNNIEQNINSLDEYNPTILVAPPSVLGVIADNVTRGNIHINLQKIISVAEVLTTKDEERFKKIFKQSIIFQAYQCTEGFLAYTCESGSIHLNEDIAIIERLYLDKKRFVPIITDFRRTSQPIIRYRLNDILVTSNKHCPCGNAMSVIDRIEGREDDIFLFNSKDGDQVKVFSDMIGRCLVYVKDVREYRVVQTSPNSIIVYLDYINPDIKKSIASEFEQLSRKMSFIAPSIQYDKYKLDFSKKLKRIERLF